MDSVESSLVYKSRMASFVVMKLTSSFVCKCCKCCWINNAEAGRFKCALHASNSNYTY